MSLLDGDTTSPPHHHDSQQIASAGWTTPPPPAGPSRTVDPRFGRVGIVPWTFAQTVRGAAATLIPWVAFILLAAGISPQSSSSSRPLSPMEDTIGALTIVIFTAVVEGAFLVAPAYFAVMRRRQGITAREGLRALGFRRTRLLPASGWVIGGLIVVYAVSILYQIIITRFSLDLRTNVDTLQQLGQHAPLTVVGTLIGAVFIAPFCEEIFFRGFMLAGFLQRIPVWAAVLLSSLLFGIAHGDVGSFTVLLVIGIVLAIVRWRTGSIWPGMALHMANNAIAAVAVLLTLGH